MWGLIMDHGQEGRAGWGLVAKGQWGCHFKCIFVIPETKGKNTLQVNKYIWFNSCSFVFLYAWKKTSTLVSLFLASFSTPHYSQSLSLLWLFHSLLFCYVMSLLVKKKKNFGGREKNMIRFLWDSPTLHSLLIDPASLHLGTICSRKKTQSNPQVLNLDPPVSMAPLVKRLEEIWHPDRAPWVSSPHKHTELPGASPWEWRGPESGRNPPHILPSLKNMHSKSQQAEIE